MRRFWRSGDSTSNEISGCSGVFLSETVEDYRTVSCRLAVVKFRMNDRTRSGDGTGSFEVKIRTNTAMFTNMIIAIYREQIFGQRK